MGNNVNQELRDTVIQSVSIACKDSNNTHEVYIIHYAKSDNEREHYFVVDELEHWAEGEDDNDNFERVSETRTTSREQALYIYKSICLLYHKAV